jgi:hypothetical protein
MKATLGITSNPQFQRAASTDPNCAPPAVRPPLTLQQRFPGMQLRRPPQTMPPNPVSTDIKRATSNRSESTNTNPEKRQRLFGHQRIIHSNERSGLPGEIQGLLVNNRKRLGEEAYTAFLRSLEINKDNPKKLAILKSVIVEDVGRMKQKI